ncbi:hypothetical protein CAEBREN_12599 [Caenorhabditis brenneri]|uniref:Uncharacterized protein n=1 Tax=Caenorhabditis brenneri TaxID=135651 RepID=G0MJA8_CAEBE|nr:hypothetical protein CAEBREN_12599 [Caenorhabditis brenneri]
MTQPLLAITLMLSILTASATPELPVPRYCGAKLAELVKVVCGSCNPDLSQDWITHACSTNISKEYIRKRCCPTD